MAKYGEGDKRWIVSERADGTNVHNWHWAERDCLEWSRSLLSSLLSDLTILEGEGGISLRTKSLDKLDGEAYVNVRKGKVIPGYELSLSLSFEAESRSEGDADVRLSGSVEIPYLADENAGEDPELRIIVRDDDGPIGRRVKDAFIAKGKPVVLEKIRSYVQAMSNGGPAKDELEVKTVPSGSAQPTVIGKTAVTVPAGSLAADNAGKKKKKEKEGFKTIKMIERFRCRTRDIYEILMDENRWKGFTQSNARISREVGGQFSLFDGSISGVNEELQEGKLIVQKWRFNSWIDGIYSSVRLEFDEPEPGVSVVKLTQTGVPEEDSPSSAKELPTIAMSSSPSTLSTAAAAAAASYCLHPITFWCHECDMSVSLLPSPSTLLCCPHCHRHDSLLPLDSSFPPISLTPFFPTHPSSDLVPPNPNPDPDEEDGGFDLTPRPLPSPGDSISAIPTVVIGEAVASVCAICKDDLPSGSSARRLPCSHLYHSDCIVPWLSIRNSCPLCRSPIPCPRRSCSLRRPRTPRFRVRVFEIDDEDDGDFEAAVRRIVGEPRTVAAAEFSPTQMGLEETGSAGPTNSGETVSSEWPAGNGLSAGEEAGALMSDVWEDVFN